MFVLLRGRRSASFPVLRRRPHSRWKETDTRRNNEVLVKRKNNQFRKSPEEESAPGATSLPSGRRELEPASDLMPGKNTKPHARHIGIHTYAQLYIMLKISPHPSGANDGHSRDINEPPRYEQPPKNVRGSLK